MCGNKWLPEAHPPVGANVWSVNLLKASTAWFACCLIYFFIYIFLPFFAGFVSVLLWHTPQEEWRSEMWIILNPALWPVTNSTDLWQKSDSLRSWTPNEQKIYLYLHRKRNGQWKPYSARLLTGSSFQASVLSICIDGYIDTNPCWDLDYLQEYITHWLVTDTHPCTSCGCNRFSNPK